MILYVICAHSGPSLFHQPMTWGNPTAHRGFLMNKKNSRIIILTYFHFLTIFDGIENSSCSENGETKDTTCMDRCTTD